MLFRRQCQRRPWWLGCKLFFCHYFRFPFPSSHLYRLAVGMAYEYLLNHLFSSDLEYVFLRHDYMRTRIFSAAIRVQVKDNCDGLHGTFRVRLSAWVASVMNQAPRKRIQSSFEAWRCSDHGETKWIFQAELSFNRGDLSRLPLASV